MPRFNLDDSSQRKQYEAFLSRNENDRKPFQCPWLSVLREQLTIQDMQRPHTYTSGTLYCNGLDGPCQVKAQIMTKDAANGAPCGLHCAYNASQLIVLLRGFKAAPDVNAIYTQSFKSSQSLTPPDNLRNINLDIPGQIERFNEYLQRLQRSPQYFPCPYLVAMQDDICVRTCDCSYDLPKGTLYCKGEHKSCTIKGQVESAPTAGKETRLAINCGHNCGKIIVSLEEFLSIPKGEQHRKEFMT